MDTLPHEAQLALTSFLIALAVGGPVTLVGTTRTLTAVRWIGAFLVRRRLTTGVLASLVGGAGFFGPRLVAADGEFLAGVASRIVL